MKDSDGRPLKLGDKIVFSFGIPPTQVIGPIEEIDGKVYVMTKEHKPDKCLLSELEKHVGHFSLYDEVWANSKFPRVTRDRGFP